MKKFLLSFTLMVLCFFFVGSIYAQYASSWAEVIKEERGDVVVVKGFFESSLFNTLITAVKGDTTATGERKNINRIYETIPGEIYVSDATLELDVTVPVLRVVAPEAPAGVAPPVHVRSRKQDNTFDKTFFQTPGNMYMKNQYFCFVTIGDAYEEREFVRLSTAHASCVYEGCIFELTAWTQQLPQASYQTFRFKDCKFINVGREATLEKGCMIETRATPPDTIWVENCTFLNGGSLIISLDQTAPNFVYFNHNTVVNCLQPPLCFSTAAEMIVENNLFVNVGFVPDYPGFYTLFDDDDQLPKGIVNSDTVETYFIESWWASEGYPLAEKDRKILFDRNAAWWDARFDDMFKNQLLPVPAENGGKWLDQKILMNDRTKAMFDDDAAYPYFTLGNNITDIQPDFKNNQDLVPEWVNFTVTNCTPGAPNGGDFMPNWRTNTETQLYIVDWPMLADLSYSNETLKKAAMGGFPLGDLNWFPAEKAEWLKRNEEAMLWDNLYKGTIPSDVKEIASIQGKMEVYPNPVKNNAVIRFNISKPANVQLSVYNIMGERVRVMNLGHKYAGNHEVDFVKGELSKGLYLINMNVGNNNLMCKKISIE